MKLTALLAVIPRYEAVGFAARPRGGCASRRDRMTADRCPVRELRALTVLRPCDILPA